MKYHFIRSRLLPIVAALLLSPALMKAKDLTETGSYKVRLANSANHLNCRTGPGTHFPIRTRLEQGQPIQVLHVTPHQKPWFYINLRCFVRASSSFLVWQEETTTNQAEDKPKIIR